MTYQAPWMNDELKLFRATVRRFIEEEVLPHQARWQQQGRPDATGWTQAGAAEVLLTDIPEEYGGGGGTIAHEAVKAEELAQIGVHFGFTVQSVVAHYILAYGNESQKQMWLPRMARGELVGAIAMTEAGAGSDLQGIKTSARRDGPAYVINGSKTFVTNGWHAGIIALAVRTDATVPGFRGISLIMVEPKNLPGYKVGNPLHKVGMHAQDTCELFFDDVRVPASNLLGSSEGKGFSQMMSQLSYERLLVGVSAVATAEKAVALTTRYAKDRMVFGKPLFDLQNTRFKLAECKTEAHIGRVFLDNCIEGFIAGKLDATAAAMAKYWLTDCEGRILDECVQLHGGYGYMTEYAIARMWADSRVHRIYAGANEIMKELIAISL
ncbi:MAG: acyl-CoA dehydrogenase family protein [Terracidiphilus sp.]|jgi:acyl-CoA dehydrogenase